MTDKKTFSATIFYKPNTKRPRKYRNISRIENFIKFATKDPEAYYINWYNQKSGIFVSRDWLRLFK